MSDRDKVEKIRRVLDKMNALDRHGFNQAIGFMIRQLQDEPSPDDDLDDAHEDGKTA